MLCCVFWVFVWVFFSLREVEGTKNVYLDLFFADAMYRERYICICRVCMCICMYLYHLYIFRFDIFFGDDYCWVLYIFLFCPIWRFLI